MPDFGALQRALVLLEKPHPQVLACLSRGEQPYGTITDADPEELHAAVARLLDCHVVSQTSPDRAGANGRLALTRKGEEVAAMVAQLYQPTLNDLDADDDASSPMS